ncbi:MAG: TlpA disulfide reductase family protein [Planctomycetota bacterium]|nr:TlpA disulfide reductase family protein [Planctomycetota bacterium]
MRDSMKSGKVATIGLLAVFWTGPFIEVDAQESRDSTEQRPDEQLEARRRIEQLLDHFHSNGADRGDRMVFDAERHEQVIRQIEQFLERFPNTPARERLEKAKLRSVFLLSTIRGQTFDRLRSEAARVHAGKPSDSLEHEAEYWKLRVDLSLAPPASAKEGVVTTQRVDEGTNAVADHVMRFASSMDSVRLIVQLIRDAHTRRDLTAAERWLDMLDAAHDRHVSTNALRGRHLLNRALGNVWTPTFENLDGRSVDLQAYRGAITVIIFWAPRYTPAMKLLGRVRDFQNRSAAGALQVVAVAIDTDIGRVEEAVRGLGVDWPIVCDGQGWASPWAEDFGIRGLPTALLVDRQGILTQVISTETDDVISDVEARLASWVEQKTPKDAQ